MLERFWQQKFERFQDDIRDFADPDDDYYPIGRKRPPNEVYLLAGATDIHVTHPKTDDEWKVVVDGDELRCERIDE